MTPGSEPEMTQINTKRDFKTVTTTKNKIVKAINNSLSDEAIIEYINRELPKALEEYTSIVFALAGIETKVQTESDFEYLKKLDFHSFLTSNRLIDTQVKEAKFFSLLDEYTKSSKEMVLAVNKLVKAPVSKPDPSSSPEIQATMARVEKVLKIWG